MAVRTPKKGQRGVQGITTVAEQESERDSDLDQVWCVLDHDERDSDINNFRTWLAQKQDENTGSPDLRAVISIPCFEYWLLLHFTFTTKPFRGMPGGPSACDQVIRELETHLDGYKKADPATYDRCSEHLPTAIQNAMRGGGPGKLPSTEVWELVEKLQEMDEVRRRTSD